MKIAYFSENQFVGKVVRNYANMRTEFAFMAAGDMYHNNIHWAAKPDYDLEEYELGIVVIPKDQNIHLDKIRSKCKKLALFQEGPHDYWNRYTVANQKQYLSYLDMMDFILCHNEFDVPYFSGLTNKNCYVLRSLMITDILSENLDYDRRAGCMIGAGFSDWYNGHVSYLIAKEFQEDIFCPKMGRNGKDEDTEITDVNFMPYMRWQEFQNYLNCVKYAVHLMPVIAAGSFMLNCAYRGIPCVSYDLADTAKYCHQYTSVNLGNIKLARKIAKELKNNKEFYNECAEITSKKYKEEFSEQVWLERFNNICKKEKICI